MSSLHTAPHHSPHIILGIETSCDETAAAIYHSEKGLLSSELFSQIDLHKAFGGVIPELASRSHLQKINPIIKTVLEKTNCSLNDLSAIAVTTKPGLPGSLLIGLNFAKALAWAHQKPLIGIDHLEGHVFSSFLEHTPPFPHLCLTASGGHTSLYLVHDFGVYEPLGHTVDDAAGEAFDKVAKLMGLPYPGGPVIERLAREVDFHDFFHYPRHMKGSLNFSFSGLKTAVFYSLIEKGYVDLETRMFDTSKPDAELIKKQVASSLLVSIADTFKEKLSHAIALHPHVQAITFVGGVACNSFIRNHLKKVADHHSINFFHPSPKFCTDNGAMIAYVGNYKYTQGETNNFTLDILQSSALDSAGRRPAPGRV